MPGKGKYRSIQNPRMYRALKRRGFSKMAAAKISNARSPGGVYRKGGRRKKRR
jgi:hypothetical protein